MLQDPIALVTGLNCRDILQDLVMMLTFVPSDQHSVSLKIILRIRLSGMDLEFSMESFQELTRVNQL